MQENHNDQPIKLTYPVKIQFSDPNETNDSNQPMEQDSDREQPSIRRENITFTSVVEARLSSAPAQLSHRSRVFGSSSGAGADLMALALCWSWL